MSNTNWDRLADVAGGNILPTNLDYEIFGLLYIDDSVREHVNLKNKHRAIDVYVKCAHLMVQTAARQGERARIITNNSQLIDDTTDRLGLSRLKTVIIDFELNIPRKIPFYQAHFKICVLRAFANGLAENAVLIDLDAIVIRPFTVDLPTDGSLAVYDITDQVPYVAELTAPFHLVGTHVRWFGGEFIAGSKQSFSNLCAEIELVLPIYLANLGRRQFTHIGDETIVSAALNRLVKKGVKLTNIGGERGLVARWWSARTDSIQQHFSKASTAAVLHLPADKLFLARQAGKVFPDDFLQKYINHIQYRIACRYLLNPVLNLIRCERKYTAHL